MAKPHRYDSRHLMGLSIGESRLMYYIKDFLSIEKFRICYWRKSAVLHHSMVATAQQ